MLVDANRASFAGERTRHTKAVGIFLKCSLARAAASVVTVEGAACYNTLEAVNPLLQVFEGQLNHLQQQA